MAVRRCGRSIKSDAAYFEELMEMLQNHVTIVMSGDFQPVTLEGQLEVLLTAEADSTCLASVAITFSFP